MFIEKANVLQSDVIEVAEAEAQEVTEAFSLQRANPGFREGVRTQRTSAVLNKRRNLLENLLSRS
jgi:hypothetical protein